MTASNEDIESLSRIVSGNLSEGAKPSAAEGTSALLLDIMLSFFAEVSNLRPKFLT